MQTTAEVCTDFAEVLSLGNAPSTFLFLLRCFTAFISKKILVLYPYTFALATLSLPLLNHQKLAIFVVHSTEEI